MAKVYAILMLAVLSETIATSALHASQQFTRLWPSVIVVIGYAISFYLLSLTLKTLPVGIMYAIWCGLGIVFVAIIGYFAFQQRLDLPAILGIGLILCGIVVINLFSESAGH
ncbi:MULTISPECIES: DMT family transporter [Shimia]|uniref:DMT family transporter n=1 Tax=Shimia TaxID=573139 RepID=UPI001FB48AEE|nr:MULTISPECIES: SMR family transporter [Shimia]MDV4144204.1 SMR family transporter [Shimia sp. FJ5]